MAHQHSPIAAGAKGIWVILGIGILAACNPSGGTAPGAVSEGEASALEDAAEMLDERQLPKGALPPIDGAEQAAPDQGEAQDSGAGETE